MLKQRTLFDPTGLVRPPRARHDDPATSREAAKRADACQTVHHGIILRVLEHAGQALTAHQIATRSVMFGDPIDRIQVSRRMHELLEAHLVVVDGRDARFTRYRRAT